MQYKHPEILYFLFLLIVPILVHLFQLRRFKKEYFTNVQILKALAVQTRKSSTIKKWLLLSCRLLLLTAIIIAFAQPFFLAKDNKNASNELYIILDNSFSMQAKGKKGELLKRAVQELLEDTPENTHFSLLTNTETYWNTDIKEIQNSLQTLSYSAIPFQLDHLIAKVKSHKSSFKKDIIVITDAIGLEKKQLKGLDQANKPYFIIPKAEQKGNLAIDSVYISQTLEKFYEIEVKLSRFGENQKEVPIAIYNDNKLIAKTLITFETSTKTTRFTIPKKEFHGYVSISDNGLAYDNELFFSISKTKKIRALSIGEVSKNLFLSRIFTKDEFDFSTTTLSSLEYNALEKQDVIVLNELEEIPQALQTTLKSAVEKGTNLVVIPATQTPLSTINPFLNNFGKLQFNAFENNPKRITKINFNHPLFSGVFENKITNFQYPQTKGSFRISGSSSAALYYEDQSSFLTSLAKTNATVYVFSAPINTENSNFQQSPLIVPTFYKMAVNSNNSAVTALTIGNENPFLVDVVLSKDAVLTVKNKAEQFIPIQQILNNKVKLTFNDYPQQAGNFEVYNQKERLENISFNYSRSESNIETSNENAIADYKIIDSISTVFDTLQTERTDSQIWKWFAIFALLFMAAEMAIIRFMK